MIRRNTNISGFSIIELAIVTVIIAILVGALVVGTDVLEGAKRSALIKDLNLYKTSIANFRLKYEILPGDMDNASDYWSSANDGNGDGDICCWQNEGLYIWQHLSLADLLSQKYDGTAGSSPESESYKNTYYKVAYIGKTGDGWNLGDVNIFGRRGNFIGMGKKTGAAGMDYSGGFLTASSAQSIDAKIDDGNASSGDLLATMGYGTAAYEGYCTTPTTFIDAAKDSAKYNLSDEHKTCRLMYFLRGLD